jgi:hypothetical protein
MSGKQQNLKEIGERLQLDRKRLKIIQKDFAKELGTSGASLSHLKGKRFCKMERGEKVDVLLTVLPYIKGNLLWTEQVESLEFLVEKELTAACE